MNVEFEYPIPTTFYFEVGSTKYFAQTTCAAAQHLLNHFVWDAKRLQEEVKQTVATWNEPMEKDVLQLDVTVVHTLIDTFMLTLASYSISITRSDTSRASTKNNDNNYENPFYL